MWLGKFDRGELEREDAAASAVAEYEAHIAALEWEGFACAVQAAESLASDSLRIPRISRAGGLCVSADGFATQTKREAQIKTPAEAGVCILAETEGFEPLRRGSPGGSKA